MKSNYKSWAVSVDDFYKLPDENKRIAFLVNFALLSPSSHNTQPWSFSLKNNNTINVYRQVSRRLPIADTNDRQLFISIGCAIENIVVAAKHYGYSTEVRYVDDPLDSDLVATIGIKKEKTNNRDDDLIHSIIARRTNRNKYIDKPIDSKILDEIKALETNDKEITIVNEKQNKDGLAAIAVAASIESMVELDFRHELSHHIKHNLTNSKVGMPGFSLGIPAPVSFILPMLIKRFNMEKIAEKQNLKLFNEYTPYIVIISSLGDEKSDWIESGIIFEHLALITTKYGVSLSPWGAPVQIGQNYKNIQEVIGSKKRPHMFFRMGYATKQSKHSPRLESHEVMK